jgi:hypothetical protein
MCKGYWLWSQFLVCGYERPGPCSGQGLDHSCVPLSLWVLREKELSAEHLEDARMACAVVSMFVSPRSCGDIHLGILEVEPLGGG